MTAPRRAGITARMPPVCEECGSHDVRRGHVYGLLIEECGLCGNLQGDPADVERFGEIREAESLGVAPELVGLVRTLESIQGVAVDRALSTAAGHAEPPAVYFALTRHPLELLDRLSRTLLLASRRTTHLWTIEVTHQTRLLFVLKPRLLQAHSPRPADAAGSPRAWTVDLATLRDALRRDLRLSWWEIHE